MKRSLLATTALLTTTLAAGAATAGPAALIGGVALKIANEALGFGVKTALNSVLGPTQTPADLSEESFQRISTIVGGVVEDNRFATSLGTFKTLLTDAQANLGTAEDVDRTAELASSVANDMQSYGYRGIPSYMLAMSIQLHFREKTARLIEASGNLDPDNDGRNNNEEFRDLRSQEAEAAWRYLADERDAWTAAAAHRYQPDWRAKNAYINQEAGLTYEYKSCFDSPAGEQCSQAIYVTVEYADGRRVGYNSGGNPSAQIQAIRTTTLDAEYGDIFGDDLPALIAELKVIAGNYYCPTGDYDGHRCLIAEAPAGTSPFVHGGDLYTTSLMAPTCPEGTLDGDRCLIATAPQGTHAFVHNGGLYTTRLAEQRCPAGTLDGGRCLIATAPQGAHPFVYNGGLYLTAQPGGVCSAGSFDGANCFVGWPAPGTTPVIDGQKLMTTTAEVLTCPMGAFDGANCFVGSPAQGTAAVVDGQKLMTTSVAAGTCPLGWFDGANCFVASPAPGTSPAVHGRWLSTTPYQL